MSFAVVAKIPNAESLPACSKYFIEKNSATDKHTATITSSEVEGGIINYVTALDPVTNEYCSYINYPTLEPLSGREHESLLRLSGRGSISASSMTKDFVSAKAICPIGYSVAKVYAGYCGTSGNFLGSAYFHSTHLALTSASATASGPVCLEYGGRYYDVHQVRTTGSGDSGVSGLSLMHSGPESRGLQVHLGSLGQGSAGATFGISSFIYTQPGDSSPFCYSGQTHESDTNFGVYYTVTYQSTVPPSFAPKPGGPVMLGSSSDIPMGLSTGMNYSWYPNTPFIGYTISQYPVYRRFVPAHATTAANWSATSAPPQTLTITEPANNSTIYGFAPAGIRYNSSIFPKNEMPRAFLDGVEVGLASKVLRFLTPGWHTLVLYFASNPNIRHTIRFYHS